MRASRPDVRVYAAEVETSAPFTAALAQGKPTTISSTPSFVDGIGGENVFAEMWPLARELLAGSLVASVAEIAAAVRLLVERNRIVAERREHRQRHARHDPPWRDPDQRALTMDTVEYFPVAESLDSLKLPFSGPV